MKLPAHGRALLDARRAGKHPSHVEVIFGPARPPMRAAAGVPVLGVIPEWRPQDLNWLPVAGCIVVLHDDSLPASAPVPDDLWDLDIWSVGGAIADRAAAVVVRTHFGSIVTMHGAARLARLAGGWPHWWSEVRERRVQRNLAQQQALTRAMLLQAA
jgi:hypothetical protein